VPFIFHRPLAERAVGKNASTDTKKARFTANSLGQPDNKCPVQSSHRLLLVLIGYDIAMHHRGIGDHIPSHRINAL
jgi:hypothetical protein